MISKTSEEVTTWNNRGVTVRRVTKSGKKPLYFITHREEGRNLYQLIELAKVINQVISEDELPF